GPYAAIQRLPGALSRAGNRGSARMVSNPERGGASPRHEGRRPHEREVPRGRPGRPTGPARFLSLLSLVVGRKTARPQAGRRSDRFPRKGQEREADRQQQLLHRRHEGILGLPEQSELEEGSESLDEAWD